MSKLVAIGGDPVKGKDSHKVTGSTTSIPPAVYTGIADFVYSGAVTEALSDLVRINGTSVALVTSRSTLDPGEALPPTGRHSGPQGTNFVPPAPAPNPLTLAVTDVPLGTGTPNSAAGSTLLTINGIKVLLDADPIDTCSGVGAVAGSSVTARGQNFVTSAV